MYAAAEVERVEEILRGADIVVLGMVLVQWTGDESLLDELRPYVKGPWDYLTDVPEALADRIRRGIAERVLALEAGEIDPPPAPSLALARRMMDTAVGQFVPDEYVPMLLEDIALQTLDQDAARDAPPPSELSSRFTATIIGGGMSGILAAIKLKEAGVDFVLYEKSDSLGGVWYQNTYPGCGVDTPNHFYTFSFARNDDWSHYFSKRDELYRYFNDIAARSGVLDSVRFRSEAVRAEYDDRRHLWTTGIRHADGSVETRQSNIVIFAVGALNRPAIPDIPGLDRFAGEWCHTAEWKQGLKLAGRNVAMIGTGASGVQVGPSIAPEVARLTIFQRSPQWLSPNPNYHRPVSDGKKWALKHVPGYASWYRFQLFWGSADGNHPALVVDPEWKHPDISLNALNHAMRENLTRHILSEIEGRPDLVDKVIPTYPPYGKRMLRDNHWYKMLLRDNVDLVTERISRIDPEHVVTEDGKRYPADVIIFATGFRASEMLAPIEVRGRGGIDLRTQWEGDNPRAHLGITVPGFPNLFILFGPNTVLAHGGSAIFQSECQVHYILQALRRLAQQDRRALEVRKEIHDAYNERVDRQHARMVWAHPGVSNWYRNRRGRVTVAQPWRMIDYWRWTRDVDPAEYDWY